MVTPFLTANFSPKGANRAHYSNARLDALLNGRNENPDQAARRKDYVEAQQILASDLPAFNLWYLRYDCCSQPEIDQCDSFIFRRLWLFENRRTGILTRITGQRPIHGKLEFR